MAYRLVNMPSTLGDPGYYITQDAADPNTDAGKVVIKTSLSFQDAKALVSDMNS